MMIMPQWVLGQIAHNLGRLTLASLPALLPFGLLLLLDSQLSQMSPDLAGEAAKQQRKDVLGYAIYAIIFLVAACHGLIWTLSRLFLTPPDQPLAFAHWGERFGFALGWRPIRSLWITLGWVLFAVFAFVAVGSVLGALGFRDSGQLIESTAQQAAELSDGVRPVIQRGEIVQNVTAADFRGWVLWLTTGVSATFAIWILLKALVAVPMRVLGGQVNILHALYATRGLAGIRVCVWVMVLGGIIWAVNALGLVLLPPILQALCQMLLFIAALWLVGGMLAWHVQRHVTQQVK